MQEEIWGPEDVERVYNIRNPTVRQWCRKGLFPAFKVGKLWRFKRTDFEGYMKSNQEVPKKVDGLAAFAH
jgi:excisionase family DNA binding protein